MMDILIFCPVCGNDLKVVMREFEMESNGHRITTPLAGVYVINCPNPSNLGTINIQSAIVCWGSKYTVGVDDDKAG